MNTKKLLFLLILSGISFATNFSLNAQANICTKHNCGKDRNCQCYCSFKGDYREQTLEDAPIYLAKNKDPLGVGLCYCAQRDIDHLNTSPNVLAQQKAQLQAKKTARQVKSAAAQEYRKELADVILEDQDIIY